MIDLWKCSQVDFFLGGIFMDIMKYQVGDVVKMKKPHPCGINEWQIIRTGVDFGLKCVGCQRQVMISRIKFELAVSDIIRKNEQN